MFLDEADVYKLLHVNDYHFEIGVFLEKGRKTFLLNEEPISYADYAYINENGSALRGLPSRRDISNAVMQIKLMLDSELTKIKAIEELEKTLINITYRVNSRLKNITDDNLRGKIECRLYKNNLKIS